MRSSVKYSVAIEVLNHTHITHKTTMKQQTKDFINKIKDKMKDPITKRKKYSNGDAVLDDAVAYYYDELKHSKQL